MCPIKTSERAAHSPGHRSGRANRPGKGPARYMSVKWAPCINVAPSPIRTPHLLWIRLIHPRIPHDTHPEDAEKGQEEQEGLTVEEKLSSPLSYTDRRDMCRDWRTGSGMGGPYAAPPPYMLACPLIGRGMLTYSLRAWLTPFDARLAMSGRSPWRLRGWLSA